VSGSFINDQSWHRPSVDDPLRQLTLRKVLSLVRRNDALQNAFKLLIRLNGLLSCRKHTLRLRAVMSLNLGLDWLLPLPLELWDWWRYICQCEESRLHFWLNRVYIPVSRHSLWAFLVRAVTSSWCCLITGLYLDPPFTNVVSQRTQSHLALRLQSLGPKPSRWAAAELLRCVLQQLLQVKFL